MNRALLVGDVHATPEELEDCQKLIDYIQQIALETGVEEVVFMGDLYHTMSVLRVEVLAFWRAAFNQLTSANLSVYALVGNHDYAGEGLLIHSLLAHEQQVHVVAGPREMFPGVLLLPYMSDHQQMVTFCNMTATSTLLCHQTFQGATYDNGFYAPDGVDPEAFPQTRIISGHVHSPQSFGKVTYIGAPRWRTLSDANIDRAIWVYEFDDKGAVTGATPYSTNEVCRRIRSADHTPDAPCALQMLQDGSDWRIDIKGPVDWIEAQKAALAVPGVRIRTFKTDRAVPKVRESEGIDKAWMKFLESYVPRHGTDKARLVELARERL